MDVGRIQSLPSVAYDMITTHDHQFHQFTLFRFVHPQPHHSQFVHDHAFDVNAQFHHHPDHHVQTHHQFDDAHHPHQYVILTHEILFANHGHQFHHHTDVQLDHTPHAHHPHPHQNDGVFIHDHQAFHCHAVQFHHAHELHQFFHHHDHHERVVVLLQ